MIRDTLSHKNKPALTSDRWHVVHASWTGARAKEPRFERTIVSEHPDHEAALEAARALAAALTGEMSARSGPTWDQVFVRRPHFKSLRTARRRKRLQ